MGSCYICDVILLSDSSLNSDSVPLTQNQKPNKDFVKTSHFSIYLFVDVNINHLRFVWISLALFCMNSLFSYPQAELTFCAGDVITVFGEIDEDGFYYVSIS